MTLALALALSTALGQPAEAPAHAGAEESAAAPTAPVGHPAGHGEAAAGHGGEEHGLSDTMIHHVANGERLDVPGFCPDFHWNCVIDLRQLTGGWSFTLGGVKFDMTPSKHVVMMWLAAALLVLTLLVAGRGRSLVPRGLYNFFELLVQFVRDVAIANIGKRDADRFVPYLCSTFFFILFMNLLGLVPFLATATANLSVTAGLALFTFAITQYAAIRAQGIGGYLAHLTGGVPKSLAWLWPIMIPVEFLGLFTKPFALTVRLFANMVAGHFVILALLGLIFVVSTFVAPASVALALGIYMLEIFVALVQAYIFTMLSALFIGSGLVHHGAGHAEGHGQHGPAGQGEAGAGSHVSGSSPGHG